MARAKRSEGNGVHDDLYPSSLFGPEDMPKLLSQKPLRLTPTKAAELAKLDVYLRQRSRKPHILAMIEDAIRRDIWYGNRIAVAKLDFDYHVNGEVVREVVVNGGHTIQSHIEHGFTTGNNQILTFECHNPNALAVLYSVFDRGESTRSTEDQCAAFIDAMPDVKAWNKSSVNKCSTAVAVAKYGFSYRTFTKVVDRVALLKSPANYSHGAFLRDLIYRTDGGITRNRFMAKAVAVMSVIFATHVQDSEAASNFWNTIRTGVGLKSGSPELSLHKFLLQTSAGGGMDSKTLYVISFRCHQAWNAFRLGKKCSLKGRISPQLPLLL